MNSNNRWPPWLNWGVFAVLALLWCVWWIHFRPLPHTNPSRSLGLHGTLLLGDIVVWLSAYYRRNGAGRWWFWAWSFVVGFSIPAVLEDLLHINHVRTLSPVEENALLIFGFFTAIGLGFLAQRREYRGR